MYHITFFIPHKWPPQKRFIGLSQHTTSLNSEEQRENSERTGHTSVVVTGVLTWKMDGCLLVQNRGRLRIERA